MVLLAFLRELRLLDLLLLLAGLSHSDAPLLIAVDAVPFMVALLFGLRVPTPPRWEADTRESRIVLALDGGTRFSFVPREFEANKARCNWAKID